MKKLTVLLLMLLAIMLMLVSCGKEQSSLGQIEEINESSIVVALGTAKEDAMAGGENALSESPENDSDQGENLSSEGTPPKNGGAEQGSDPPSMLDFTGETVELEITGNTVITKEGSEDFLDISALSVGNFVSLTYEGHEAKTVILQEAGGGVAENSSVGSIELTAVETIDGTDEILDGETVAAEEENLSSVLVRNGGNLTANGARLTKRGDTSSEDESNFYGLNAGFVVSSNSTADLTDVTISTEAEGANAIFATGEGASASIHGITIHTTGNSSRGLDATYGGSIVAEDVDITTTGDHCATLATDRGEGTINVTGGTLSTAGDGSPCIYSTGDIVAEDITGTATGSQSMVVEGKNSITIEHCDLTGAGPNGVMIYQSTSGDAELGTGVLTAADSAISTISDGPMFYITNTEAEIHLTNVELNFDSNILVDVAGNNTNNWGIPGANGGNLTFTAKKQILMGDVLCDDISAVALDLSEGSTFTGAVDADNSGTVSIALSSDSVWEVTADSYVSSITDDDESLANIVSNGHTIYYDSDNEANAWLNGATVTLDGGGALTPQA